VSVESDVRNRGDEIEDLEVVLPIQLFQL